MDEITTHKLAVGLYQHKNARYNPCELTIPARVKLECTNGKGLSIIA